MKDSRFCYSRDIVQSLSVFVGNALSFIKYWFEEKWFIWCRKVIILLVRKVISVYLMLII